MISYIRRGTASPVHLFLEWEGNAKCLTQSVLFRSLCDFDSLTLIKQNPDPHSLQWQDLSVIHLRWLNGIGSTTREFYTVPLAKEEPENHGVTRFIIAAGDVERGKYAMSLGPMSVEHRAV